jgi:hypothetical protein
MDVGPVVMFDSHPPEAYLVPDPKDIDYEVVFSKVLLELLEGDSLLEHADAFDVKQFCERWSYCFRLLKAHNPSLSVDTKMTIFTEKKRESPEILSDLNMREVEKVAWKKYFKRSVQFVPVDGDHFSMFGDSFYVKNLAREFDSFIRQLETPAPDAIHVG